MDTLYYKGFFARDTLLAADTLLFRQGPASATETVGYALMPMPQALRRNDIVTGMLLVGFAMLLLMLRAKKPTLRTRITEFIYPSQTKNPEDTPPYISTTQGSTMVAMITSLLVGLLFFCYVQTAHNISIMPVSAIELLAIYVGTAMAVIAVKTMAYKFVNAVFFTKAQRTTWNTSYALINTLQCTMLFPITLMAVYFDLSVKNTVIALLIVLLFVKIPLLFKAYTTFFVKSYGAVHIFLYFCTLEAVPLIVLWSLMTQTTIHLEQI